MSLLESLPRICIALGFSAPAELLRHAQEEVESGENFFEFRLDYLERPQDGPGIISRFLNLHPDCCVLATCRRHQNGGRFNGSIGEQIQILDAAVGAGARAVDVEVESAEAVHDGLNLLRGRAVIILSYHNFEGTPAMDTVLRRMLRIPADAYKLVTTARKPSDNYCLLSAARQHPHTPLILLATGEMGFPSRVLAQVFGSAYTYAAPGAAEHTAAGLVCARMLRRIYRVEQLTKSLKVYGIIADPVRHSISPAVHNRAFQLQRIEAVYLPFLVPLAQLKDFMALAQRLPITGFSVTTPHKERILRYLDGIEPLAGRIGAVNTVSRRGRTWRGANTDAAAVMMQFERQMNLANSSVLIVGSGGAARSAAFALAGAGARVSIVGRSPDRVRALAKACGAKPLMTGELPQSYFDALVHATPLGMFPRVDACFFPDRIPADVVFDMVYNPIDTVLIRRAREQGKTAVPGLAMFVEQAARQFELWTGETAPRAAMEKAAVEAVRMHHQGGAAAAENGLTH